MFILDTDRISLFQRNHPIIVARVSEAPPDKLATTLITFEEQIRGRLNVIRKAKSDNEIVRAYENLYETLLFFENVRIINFDIKSQLIFKNLRERKIRIGTQDLRIAAITLAHDATIVTRNRRDFIAVPSLKIEDWSLDKAE